MEEILASDGSRFALFTADERPDCWVQARAAFRDLWPEYNHHGDVSGQYFEALFPQHAHLQVLVYDPEIERVIARGRTIPLRWNGTLEDLPAGIDAAGLRAITDTAAPTALSALAAEVSRDHQGRGLSGLLIRGDGAQGERRRLGAPPRAGLPQLETPIHHHSNRAVRVVGPR